ncbi:MAG: threonine synthase [Hirschia sp.]|nr:threonine synthase [Hirschia sp.]MBF17074.1 threonine synthase [Hirschia sp.]
MRYVSTRGGADPVDFVTASLAGLAPDGGLYTPEAFPQIERPSADEPYHVTAARIIKAFAGDSLSLETLTELSRKAYAAFSHQSVAPLVQTGQNQWMMELHHGPTLAFKDVAMRFIAQLYEHALGERGERMTIICATSGDTGGAAAAAFAGLEHVDVVILHPHDRISPVQRVFMSATGADNIHNLALEGDFDQCQAIVKALFADEQTRRSLNLSGVNSINWTRIAAQSVYFATAQAQLGADRPLRFVVPSGNFGDALAGYVAARCGLLAGFECHVAVNANDAMKQLLNGGDMQKGTTTPTASPAMDIQIPSNFERLLFEATGRDGAVVKAAYDQLAAKGVAPLPERAAGVLGCMGFKASSVSDKETFIEMRKTLDETGWLVCPHTAVGLHAARHAPSDIASVVLSTAHAAKFPETVKQATEQDAPLPIRAHGFVERDEVYETGPMELSHVRDRLRALSRVSS